jgi:hypothetical protein
LVIKQRGSLTLNIIANMFLLVAYGAEPHSRHGEEREKYGMSLF